MAKKKRNRRPAPPRPEVQAEPDPKPAPQGSTVADGGDRLGRIFWLGPILLAVIALGVYIASLAPAVPVGDSGELITASYIAGVAHPPGYPLYTMLGWVATHLWSGSPAVIMNFLSALAHAGAVWLIAVLTARLVVPGWPRSEDRASGLIAGLAAGAALAFSTVFWEYGLVAEVFALNNLFAAAILLVTIEWYRDRSRVWALASLGILSGLAAAHQQQIIFLAPGLIVLLVAGWREDHDRKPARHKSTRRAAPDSKVEHFLVSASLIGVGLATYIYLPIAASSEPPLNFGDPVTFGRFWRVLRRLDYGSSYQLIPSSERGAYGKNMWLYVESLGRSFTVVGIALAIAGFVYLARRHRIEFWALIAAFATSGPFFVLLASSEITTPLTEGILQRFYLLSSVIVAIAIGAGVLYMMALIGSWSPAKAGMIVAATAMIATVGYGALVAFRFDDVDQSDNYVAREYGRDILARLEPNAMLLSRGDHNYTSLVHAQFVEGLRPDVALVEIELLQRDFYLDELHRRYPALEFPFDVYNDNVNSLIDLVEANIDRMPIYLAGPMPVDLIEAVTEVRSGLVRKVALPAGGDEYEALVTDPSLATDLSYPEGDYAEKTWENLIATNYGNAAHAVAFALHAEQPDENDALVEEMYRKSIDIGPPPEAYKNLGLFLFERNRDAAEIVELWETYISLSPDDPQIPAIETAIEGLKAGIAAGG